MADLPEGDEFRMVSVKNPLKVLIVFFLLSIPLARAQPQKGGPSFSVPAFIHSVNFEQGVEKCAYLFYQVFQRDYPNEVVSAEGAIYFPDVIRPRLFVIGGGYFHSFHISNRFAAVATLNVNAALARDGADLSYFMWTGLRYQTHHFSLEPAAKILLMRYVRQKVREFRISLRYKKDFQQTGITSSVSVGFHRRVREEFSITKEGIECLYYFSITRRFKKTFSIALFLQGRLRSDYIIRSSEELESKSPSLAYRIVFDNPQAHSIGLSLVKRFQFSAIVDYLSKNKAPGLRAIANFPIF
ncbi:MAG: hypothetical protein Q9P90_10490 [candidate division KSB1 bacterium]|nr:hypothetical protein [candidate division KSB1 bacterium]